MEIDGLKAAIKAEPLLIFDLLPIYKDGFLKQTSLYLPGCADEKYNQFCDKLELKAKPKLCVVDDDAGILDPGVNGTYRWLSNTVCVPRSIFEGFINDDVVASYSVAHELGHAKSYQLHSRRKFLEKSGAVLMGVLAGKGTEKAVRAILETKTSKDTEKEQEEPLTTSIAASAALYSAAAFTMSRIFGIFTRAEEFRADAYAQELIPPDEIVGVLVQRMEKVFLSDPNLKDQLDQIRLTFDGLVAAREQSSGNVLSESKKQFLWGVVLAEASSPERTLTDVIKGNLYPNFQDRIKKIYKDQIARTGERVL